MPTIYDLLAKIGWDTNAKELEKTIDITRTQGKMVDELNIKNKRLEKQIRETNDPVKLKKYNDQLQANKKSIDNVTTAQKKQTDQVATLTAKQKQFNEELKKASDPKQVQGLLRGLHQVEQELRQINTQATVLPSKIGGIGKTLLAGLAGGLVGGGIVGAIQIASNAISGFFGDSIKEAAEAEQGLLKFKQTLDNLGKGELFNGLVADADNLAKAYKNLFDNDDILAGQAKFIEGTRVTEKQLKQLIPVSIELAAKLGTDVTTASEMLTNAIIGRTSPELKRLGLNMKGVGTETGRVSEITGDFAKLLSGSVETALQTATGSTKQLNQELANLEEELGKKLLPLQKALTKFKIGLVELVSDAITSDDDKIDKAIQDKADRFTKGVLNFKGDRISDADFQKRVAQRTKEVELLEKAKSINDNLISQHKSVNQTIEAEKRNQTIVNELIERKGELVALQQYKQKKAASDKAINPNAGADDPTDPTKKGETADQRAARLLREQEESNKIIREAKLSLLDEEQREITAREQKYEEDKKKLRNVSAADRLAFEEALQQDLADIRDKYNQKELARLDKQNDDINQKAYDAARERIMIGAKKDQAKRDMQQDNIRAMQDFVKGESDMFKSGYDERMMYQDMLIQNTRDLIAVGQDYLDAEIRRTEKQIGLQEDRVNEAKKSSTASVKIEEDRLNALIAKRQKYEQAQRVIDAAVIVANQAVAISGAIRTIATSGNPVLIAANVVAIAAGIAASTLAVRNAFSDDGFYDGGYTGDGNPKELSRAQGKRGYKYHKGEFVMNHELTEKHRDMFEGIHKGELMVKQIGDGYYLAPQLDVDNAVSDAGANKAMDFYGMETKLDYIATLLMQRELKVNNNFDADGFGQSVAGSLNKITLQNLRRK